MFIIHIFLKETEKYFNLKKKVMNGMYLLYKVLLVLFFFLFRASANRITGIFRSSFIERSL